MKQIYNILVYENYTSTFESILNGLRIGLNDRDRSKVFELNGERVVNYTIMTTDETYTYIVELING